MKDISLNYGAAFSALPGQFIILDINAPHFTMLGASDSYLEITDKTRDELKGKGVFEVFPDTSELALKTGKGALQRSLENVIRTNKPDSLGTVRYDIRTSAGTEVRYWKATHYPVIRNDKLLYILQSTEDVTEIIKSAEQAESTEQSLKFMADSMPQLVWVTRPDGYHEYYNKRWYEYTGTKEGSTDGEGWNNLFHPNDRARAKRVWQRSLKTGQIYEIKYRLYNASSDTYRWVIGRALPYRDANGTILKWYGTCTDVDDSISELEQRKRLQSELREEKVKLEARVKERTSQLRLTNDGLRDEIRKRRKSESSLKTSTIELERSNKELENFAYVSSHDLQEPLRKIRAFGDILEDEYSAELGDGLDYLKRMRSAANRMSTLIEDLLAFSRVTTSPMERAEVDLSEICRVVISDLEALIRREDGRIDCKKLPTIFADHTHMRQLFQNLISNGLKFHKKGVSPHITIDATQVKNQHIITVSDNGIGIEKKYIEKIFAVFQRLNTRQQYEGNGIGLAVCKKIVERYGGTISVESVLEKGTKFTIRFPVA